MNCFGDKNMKKVIIISCYLVLVPITATAACLTTAAATAPASAFIDNGDRTVTHIKSGLMWKQCSEGLSGVGCATGTAATYTWQGALQAAQTLNNNGVGFATYTDWRVPNIKELDLIVEHQCSNPSIDTATFPATVAGSYWSSTSWPAAATHVVGMNFGDSNDAVTTKVTTTFYLRLVRGGL